MCTKRCIFFYPERLRKMNSETHFEAIIPRLTGTIAF